MKDAELLQVHHETVREDGTPHITKVTPYLAIKSGDHPPLFLKGGKVYGAGGDVSKSQPPGFWALVARITDAALREAGFDVSEVKALAEKEAPAPHVELVKPTGRRK